MVPVPRLRSGTMPIAILVATLMGAVALPGLASAASTALIAPAQPGTAAMQPPADIGDGRIHVAQNQQSAAQLLVRIQDLEQQMRTLTGQIEGLQFQLTQMQTMLQKQTEDNEFRFQQLEGGTPGKKTEAVPPADGATPSDAVPQDTQQNTQGAVEPLAPTDQPMDVGAVPGGDAPAGVTGQSLTPLANGASVPDDSLGQSEDPLLKGGTDKLGTITEDEPLTLDPNQPLTLTRDGGTLSQGDAKAQYDAGYDAITRGDYAFAEEQFTQFVELYPDDARAADATNWLGEALLQRGAYTDAAQVLADGYTKYKDTKRAPDMMLKLGVALAGADRVDVACRTFFTLKQRYTSLSPAFEERLAAEQTKANCPVQ